MKGINRWVAAGLIGLVGACASVKSEFPSSIDEWRVAIQQSLGHGQPAQSNETIHKSIVPSEPAPKRMFLQCGAYADSSNLERHIENTTDLGYESVTEDAGNGLVRLLFPTDDLNSRDIGNLQDYFDDHQGNCQLHKKEGDAIIWEDIAEKIANIVNSYRSFTTSETGFPYQDVVESKVAHITGLTGERREEMVYLMGALIQSESSFNPNVISKKDCMGLGQINPKYSDYFQTEFLGFSEPRYSIGDLIDPEVNIEVSAAVLWNHLNKYSKSSGKDIFDEDVMIDALRAYNAGPTALHRYKETGEGPAEMLSYSGKVMDAYARLKS